jgi:hypothetical protein
MYSHSNMRRISHLDLRWATGVLVTLAPSQSDRRWGGTIGRRMLLVSDGRPSKATRVAKHRKHAVSAAKVIVQARRGDRS